MASKGMMEEKQLTNYLFSRTGKKKIPLSGTFELSPVCNLNCRMCYIRKSIQEVDAFPRKMMTLEQWIELAQTLREQGMLYLLLTGGEPFLWPDFWDLYEKLSEMGFVISINSNGTLINDHVIKKLKQRPPMRINVTLYGASDETYEKLCGAKGMFSKVRAAITKMHENGISVKLNCSLTPINAGDLEEIVQFAVDQDLILDVATYMFPPIRKDFSLRNNERFTPEEAAYYNLKQYRLQNGNDKYIKYLRGIVNGFTMPMGLETSCIDYADGQIKCRAGKSSFWISWDGWMTPCGIMTEPKLDLSKMDFYDAWNNLIDACEKTMISGICNRCSNRRYCHSCAAMAMAETGRADGIPLYLCEMVMAAKKIAEKELFLQ